MDSKELYRLIEKPHLLSAKQVDSLDKVIKEHPYFASARLLKILDLIRKKDSKAHQEIQTGSLFIQDKKNIFDALLKIDLPKTEEQQVNSRKGDGNIRLGENKIEKIDFTNEILDELSIIGKGVKDTVLEGFIETKNEELTTPPPTKEPSKTSNITEKPEQVKVNEKGKNSVIKEVEEKKTQIDKPKKSLADEVMESLAQMKIDREERLKKMEAFEEKEKIKKSQPVSSSTKKEPQPKEKENKKTKKEKKSTSSKPKVKSSKAEAKTNPLISKKKPQQKELKKASENKIKSDQKIIQSFINKSPRIKPPKESDGQETREDLSKPSTQLPSNLVSENLANIFEKQGKISKAIAIYKQLILKYPEKKSYFAQKLRTLEK